MDGLTAIVEDAPQNGSTEVGQRGAISACQHGSHESPVTSEPQVANGVHAAVNAVQPAALRPDAYPAGAHAHVQQLGMRHHAVLPPGKLGDPPFDGGFGRLIPHVGTK